MSVVTARSDGGHAVGRHTEVVLLQSAFTSQKSMKFGVRCFCCRGKHGGWSAVRLGLVRLAASEAVFQISSSNFISELQQESQIIPRRNGRTKLSLAAGWRPPYLTKLRLYRLFKIGQGW